MTVHLSPFAGAGQQFFDNNGVVLSGGKLYTYEAGTTTPATTFTSSTGLTANANPIILDSAGRLTTQVWLTAGDAYKFILATSADVVLGTYDNIEGVNDVNQFTGSGGAALVGADDSVGGTLWTTVQGFINRLIGASGATVVRYNQGGTGAVTRDIQAKFRDCVYVTDFTGADPTGGQSSSAAFQNAINTGKTVIVPDGTYLVANLTMTTAFQQMVGLGQVRLVKNANGPILTISGLACSILNISFRGEQATPLLTGDNVVITANSVNLVNCGSRWAHGRAVKCTGSQLNIDGSNDIYQTSDASASGYDLEIGDGSNTNFYAKIIGINSTQSTGGIWLRAPGVAAIMGCQFGKLNIDPGTSPAGMHGPLVTSCRINGKTTIGVSSSLFSSTSCSADVEIVGGVTSVMLAGNFVMQAGTTLTISAGCNKSTMNLASLEGLGVTITGEGSLNSITRYGATYTPVWTGSTTNPLIGNGTVEGFYTREGRTVTATATITMGSTTTYGTGLWRVSLPFTSFASNPKAIGAVYMSDTGTIYRVGVAVLDGGSDSVYFLPDSGTDFVKSTVPFTWASTDILSFTISYTAA
jgi:hypothetical protein